MLVSHSQSEGRESNDGSGLLWQKNRGGGDQSVNGFWRQLPLKEVLL